MPKNKITVVYGDDWKGLYIDGKLAYENHSIDLQTFLWVLEKNGIRLDVECKDCDEDWLEHRGNLPKDLKEVRFHK